MLKMEFDAAYEWIAYQMKKRIGPPPDGVEFPVWAWYKQNGKHKKPDLRSERWGYGPGEEEYACIELEVPDELVLLSDFDEWHMILNNWIISDTEEEENQLESLYNGLTPEAQKRFQFMNWERALNTAPLNNGWTIRGEWVQATFWELRKEMIRNAKFLRTGKRKKV